MKQFFARLMCLAVILSLLTAIAAPACALVSGQKQWIEICKADGTLERIDVSPNQAINSIPAQDSSQDNNKGNAHEGTNCHYCFAQSQAKVAYDNTPYSITLSRAKLKRTAFTQILPPQAHTSAMRARAPPPLYLFI